MEEVVVLFIWYAQFPFPNLFFKNNKNKSCLVYEVYGICFMGDTRPNFVGEVWQQPVNSLKYLGSMFPYWINPICKFFHSFKMSKSFC